MNPSHERMWKTDATWTLFLDRDGVINRRLPDDYVRRWSEFEFLPNVLDALAGLSKRFGTIVMVTNQRGIARQLMTESDLADIHQRMLQAIRLSGGRIDRIYHCPHDRNDGCECRKPAIGHALRAKRDFPSIDFGRAIMVGDSPSDMAFAAGAGLHRVWIGLPPEGISAPPHFSFASLSEFGAQLALQ